MDRDLGAAISLSQLWAYDEPVAGWVASVAVVCGHGDRGSALSEFNFGRDGASDWQAIWKRRSGGVAESAAMAGAVVGVADTVGLAGRTAGH